MPFTNIYINWYLLKKHLEILLFSFIDCKFIMKIKSSKSPDKSYICCNMIILLHSFFLEIQVASQVEENKNRFRGAAWILVNQTSRWHTVSPGPSGSFWIFVGPSLYLVAFIEPCESMSAFDCHCGSFGCLWIIMFSCRSL